MKESDDLVWVTSGRASRLACGGVCVCVCGWQGWRRRICVLIFSFSLLSVCHQQGGSLIMFLVVFTNVSFIKLQHPQERHHPSSKVEVIITLNHLAGYLFAWLSWADGGRPQLAPEGKSCHSAPLCFPPSATLIPSYYSSSFAASPFLFFFFSCSHIFIYLFTHFQSFCFIFCFELQFL